MSKKENILITALALFASKGYNSTSTRQIAVEASVSEGLIFRHFGSKEGLLNAIIVHGISISQSYIQPILELNNPKEVIKRSIQLPLSVPAEDHEFWKLLYTLKWQRSEYEEGAFDSLHQKLTHAFRSLAYQNPELEAQLIEIYIDGLATEILLRKGDAQELTQLILNKYEL